VQHWIGINGYKVQLIISSADRFRLTDCFIAIENSGSGFGTWALLSVKNILKNRGLKMSFFSNRMDCNQSLCKHFLKSLINHVCWRINLRKMLYFFMLLYSRIRSKIEHYSKSSSKSTNNRNDAFRTYYMTLWPTKRHINMVIWSIFRLCTVSIYDRFFIESFVESATDANCA